ANAFMSAPTRRCRSAGRGSVKTPWRRRDMTLVSPTTISLDPARLFDPDGSILVSVPAGAGRTHIAAGIAAMLRAPQRRAKAPPPDGLRTSTAPRAPVPDGVTRYVMARDLAGTVFPVSEDSILREARKHGIGRKMGRAIIFSPDDIQHLYEVLPCYGSSAAANTPIG